ncbi:hypothetical protein I6E74_04700 [Salinibacterium sp. SWN139]|uniref:hypothetical protein n=1 Tax=Salinibacterium sp. SWN139 TaxID=2792055 RepID=UPI0018CF15BA|nr:hypothetical protein [Salinibacterium sp. SWN139]MBH0053471.1 hypothetical protein [Salinibacterium sp. SWN139]
MTRRSAKKSRRRATPASVLVTLGGVLMSWMLGAVAVRLGLDWSDTFPYSPASEWRYLGVAVLALAIAIGGSIATWRFARRFRRHPHADPEQHP